MKEIKFYCVTNKEIDFIKDKNFNFGWVGQSNSPKSYLRCDKGDNIYHKEKYYSELTFHYWFWKNLLKYESDDTWIGFCQKRRYWIQDSVSEKIDKSNINKYLLKQIDNTQNFDSIVCQPINTYGVKKIKLLKRGWKNILKDPSILYEKKKQNLSLHFDMHHGYNNLNKAIDKLDEKNKEDFKIFVREKNIFNPHIMFIAKPAIINRWFEDLFSWLDKCEGEFDPKKLGGYDTGRLFAYLSERYLSYWFKKYCKCTEKNWVQLDNF